jgi:hypothetical protein
LDPAINIFRPISADRVLDAIDDDERRVISGDEATINFVEVRRHTFGRVISICSATRLLVACVDDCAPDAVIAVQERVTVRSSFLFKPIFDPFLGAFCFELRIVV